MLDRTVVIRGFFAFGAMLISFSAIAQPARPETFVGIKGKCEIVTIAGVNARCAINGGVIFTLLPNGNALFTSSLDDGRVAAFVGEKDAQPRPETYFLYLSRMRILSQGTEFSAKIAGQCIVQMSHDGKLWNHLECAATDENDTVYKISFKSNGSPADVQQSRKTTQPVAAIHVNLAAVAQVSATFKAALQAGGIQGVVRDLGKCFDNSYGSVDATRVCMLYDVSAYRLDEVMHKILESRGINSPSSNPYLSRHAFNLRMQIYSRMAFDGSEKAAYEFFGSAPNEVIKNISP